MNSCDLAVGEDDGEDHVCDTAYVCVCNTLAFDCQKNDTDKLFVSPTDEPLIQVCREDMATRGLTVKDSFCISRSHVLDCKISIP